MLTGTVLGTKEAGYLLLPACCTIPGGECFLVHWRRILACQIPAVQALFCEHVTLLLSALARRCFIDGVPDDAFTCIGKPAEVPLWR